MEYDLIIKLIANVGLPIAIVIVLYASIRSFMLWLSPIVQKRIDADLLFITSSVQSLANIDSELKTVIALLDEMSNKLDEVHITRSVNK